jgi:hypothetical protein
MLNSLKTIRETLLKNKVSIKGGGEIIFILKVVNDIKPSLSMI